MRSFVWAKSTWRAFPTECFAGNVSRVLDHKTRWIFRNNLNGLTDNLLLSIRSRIGRYGINTCRLIVEKCFADHLECQGLFRAFEDR